jgi:PAS domain S-box-containing protein
MEDSEKTKEQLIIELNEARRQLENLNDEVFKKKTDQALKQWEETFYKTFNSNPNAICLVNAIDLKFVEINDSFCRFHGYAREEIIGHTPHELNLWANPAETNKMTKILQETGRLINVETKYRTKSGEIRTGLFSGQIIQLGNKFYVMFVITDITELKNMDQALKESQDKFAMAFRFSPNVISLVNMETGKFVDVNDSFTRFTGYSKEEAIGRSHEELNLWAIQDDMIRVVKALQKNGRLTNTEIKARVKSGEIRTALLSAETLDVAGKSHMIFVITDITESKKMDEALRESENKFATAFSASPNAICLVNIEDDMFVEVNDSFSRFTGYPKEEVISHTHQELNLWVNQDDMKNMRKALRETGRLVNAEIKSRMKSGEIRTGLFSAETLDIAGKKHMILVITDVTDVKKMEEALKESENKMAVAFRASPHGLAIVTMGEGKFVDVNDNVCRWTGYSRDEIIGHTVDELRVWSDQTFRARMAKQLFETGRVNNEELVWRSRSGELLSMLMSAEIADIGGKKCIVSSVTDITYLKKIEQSLRESEEKFYKAFNASPGVLSINKLSDGTFLEVNDSFTRVFGFTREEIIGYNSLESKIWVNPNDRTSMIRQLKEQGRVSNVEYLHRTKSGDILTILFSAEPIEFGDEPCVLIVTTDITEYKRMEAQAHEVANLRELDRLRTELLANVSHELRTPLASIKGFATMLLDYEKRLKAQEKREYLETIDKNTDRLVELIEQLLEMSRLGSGMLSIKKSPTNIIKLCETVVNEARVRSPDHKYILNLPHQLPPINIDHRRIRQVLDNVLDNAVKYSSAGTEITLSVHKNNKKMLFTVTDHGIGIPEKDMPRLFERMFHSTQGRRKGIVGAGLGLSICKGLIEAHGGKIWIESKEGVGTSCYFALPFSPATKDDKIEIR